MFSIMKSSRFIWLVTTIAAIVIVAGGSWYAFSPRLAIAALSDWETAPEVLLALFDRARVRAAFENQMLPQVDTYEPPYTKDVILDAMSDLRAVRMFVNEPYGECSSQPPPDCPQIFPRKSPPAPCPA